MRTLLIALVVFASQAEAAAPTRYVEFVNTARNSVTSLEVAIAGSAAFENVPFGTPTVHGGGHAVTVAVAGHACLRDLRITFSDGRTLVHEGFDVCKNSRYRTAHYLRGSTPAQGIAGQG